MFDDFSWAVDVANRVVSLLPLSPFHQYISTASLDFTYVKWINWFFPVQEVLVMLGAYLASIGSYYGIVIIGRWVKLIGD